MKAKMRGGSLWANLVSMSYETSHGSDGLSMSVNLMRYIKAFKRKGTDMVNCICIMRKYISLLTDTSFAKELTPTMADKANTKIHFVKPCKSIDRSSLFASVVSAASVKVADRAAYCIYVSSRRKRSQDCQADPGELVQHEKGF
jgi:hypothetical protein